MKIILFLQLIFLLFPAMLFASVEITEIMYDLEGSDSKREWIEIYNFGSEQINLSGWKLYENDINHKLTEQSSAILEVGTYAVIVDNVESFLTDNPNFSGLLFDSAFSLKNSGETLILRNADLEDVDTIFYDTEIGANGDGNSLQKINAVWVASMPTPGQTNQTNGFLNNEDKQSDEQENNEQNNSGGESNFPVEPQIFAFAGDDREVIVGADSVFNGKALGLENEPLANARYIWNFGDGTTKEGKKVLHHYKYPAVYAVILSVSSGEYSAISKIKVTAKPANITIFSTAGGQEGYIEIYNRGAKDLDISFWQLKLNNDWNANVFIIPEHTQILANTKIKFPAQITKLVLSDENNIRLYYPNGVEIDEMEESFGSPASKLNEKIWVPETQMKTQKEKEPKKVSQKNLPKTKKEKTIKTTKIKETKKVQNIITPRVLAATPLQATQNEKSVIWWILSIVGIVVLSLTSILFVRTKEKQHIKISKEAKETQILD